MSPDEVCDNYSGRDVRLSIRVLEGDVVLLGGDRVSLEFLAELIRDAFVMAHVGLMALV